MASFPPFPLQIGQSHAAASAFKPLSGLKGPTDRKSDRFAVGGQMLEFVSLCLISPAAAAAANESNIHCLSFLPSALPVFACPLLHFAGSEKREDGSPDDEMDVGQLNSSCSRGRRRSGSCLIISQHSAAAAPALLCWKFIAFFPSWEIQRSSGVRCEVRFIMAIFEWLLIRGLTLTGDLVS